MKKIKYILFTFLILSLSILSAYAECTKEEINTLKQEANKIKVTYKHLGSYTNDENIVIDYLFDLTFNNINADMYIKLNDEEWKEIQNNKIIIKNIASGTYIFKINSLNCQETISNIKVKIPTFNSYSLDPLCEGIDSNDFPLCSKYLEYQPSYETFKSKVEEYKKGIEKKEENNTEKENNISIIQILNKILDFITRYQLYLIIVLSLILIMLILIIIIKRRKKRGVLK